MGHFVPHVRLGLGAVILDELLSGRVRIKLDEPLPHTVAAMPMQQRGVKQFLAIGHLRVMIQHMQRAQCKRWAF